MSTTVGSRLDGPWTHRLVAANGARFHVAEISPADSGRPLVLFLHGFPEFWWAWRHQLPTVAEYGFNTAAMDLRGYGGSDKPPRGYDPITLAGDVAGLIRSLGHTDAILVGHGIGGYVAWATAALHPRQVRALAVVSAPHPLRMRRLLVDRKHVKSVLSMLSFQLPIVPERRLVAHNAALVEDLLYRWSAPGSGFPDREAAQNYREAMLLWPAPHCALEYYRWVARSTYRTDGRRFAQRMRKPITQRVLQIHGALDPVVLRSAAEGSVQYVDGPHRWRLLDGAGHFPHEEQPDDFNKELVSWLESLPDSTAGQSEQ